ncbi:MAG TPA: class I SAM-dependent methyltransferase [Solirubrobacteraceae bacterium]|jgi:SAM-dependent methyltransferase
MADGPTLSAHAAHNRRTWDEQSDSYQDRHGRQLADSGGAAWGVWQLPESQLRVLGDVHDRDVLELGCGAAQWSIALAKAGARVTALDNSARQLEHARELMSAARLDFPLVHASAEATALAAASFDIVFCDHGAMTFADPYRTVPEVARLLRPGGLLAFSSHTPIVELAWPPGSDHPTEALAFDYWGMHAIEEPGEPTAFQLPYGEWIRLFRAHGLSIEDLIELRPEADAQSSYRDERDRAWALRWPMEHIWSVRRS